MAKLVPHAKPWIHAAPVVPDGVMMGDLGTANSMGIGILFAHVADHWRRHRKRTVRLRRFLPSEEPASIVCINQRVIVEALSLLVCRCGCSRVDFLLHLSIAATRWVDSGFMRLDYCSFLPDEVATTGTISDEVLFSAWATASSTSFLVIEAVDHHLLTNGPESPLALTRWRSGPSPFTPVKIQLVSA